MSKSSWDVLLDIAFPFRTIFADILKMKYTDTCMKKYIYKNHPSKIHGDVNIHIKWTHHKSNLTVIVEEVSLQD